MATIVTKGGGGLLSGLGKAAGVAGMVTGTPWLSALGLGMGAANSAMGGDTTGALGQILEGVLASGWMNPAAGNIANANPYEAGAEDWARMRGGWR